MTINTKITMTLLTILTTITLSIIILKFIILVATKGQTKIPVPLSFITTFLCTIIITAHIAENTSTGYIISMIWLGTTYLCISNGFELIKLQSKSKTQP